MIIWLQITSGRGPEECGWVVSKLAECIAGEAADRGVRTDIIEAVTGDKPKLTRLFV